MKIWDNKWVPALFSFRVFFHKPPDVSFNTVDCLLNRNLGGWNSWLLHSIFSPVELKAIKDVNFSVTDGPDTLC